MKTFKYKFSKLIFWVIWAGIALCAVGFAVNLYFCITVGISSAADPVYPIIQYSAMFFVSVVLFVLLVSILKSSYYSVDEKNFTTSFGFIKSRYKIEDIDTIELDRVTNKLSVYFKNETYVVIVVKEEWYNDFVQAIIDVNPRIEYSIKSKENTPDDHDKK